MSPALSIRTGTTTGGRSVRIVSAFDVVSDGVLGRPPGRPRLALNELGLERGRASTALSREQPQNPCVRFLRRFRELGGVRAPFPVAPGSKLTTQP